MIVSWISVGLYNVCKFQRIMYALLTSLTHCIGFQVKSVRVWVNKLSSVSHALSLDSDITFDSVSVEPVCVCVGGGENSFHIFSNCRHSYICKLTVTVHVIKLALQSSSVVIPNSLALSLIITEETLEICMRDLFWVDSSQLVLDPGDKLTVLSYG